MEAAARELGRMGPRYVLVKGGHLAEAPVDVLWDGRNSYQLAGDRLDGRNTHGTGCALAAALATRLAQGRTLPEAVNEARELVAEAIRWGLPLGQGRGPVNPAAPFLREQERYSVLLSLAAAARRLEQGGVADLIPEVQSNLGYATIFARGPQDVAAFPGRLLQGPPGPDHSPRAGIRGFPAHCRDHSHGRESVPAFTRRHEHPVSAGGGKIGPHAASEGGHFDRSQEPPES